jgi:hypothetical protein
MRKLYFILVLIILGCNISPELNLIDPYQQLLADNSIAAKYRSFDTTFYDVSGRTLMMKNYFGPYRTYQYDENGYLIKLWDEHEGTFDIINARLNHLTIKQTWKRVSKEGSGRPKKVILQFDKTGKIIKKLETIQEYPTLSSDELTFEHRFYYTDTNLSQEDVFMKQSERSRQVQRHHYFYKLDKLIRKESAFLDKKDEALVIEEYLIDSLIEREHINGEFEYSIESYYLNRK